MVNGSTYPCVIVDANGNERDGNQITYTDSTNQPLVGANPITAGTLPNLGAWVSGTAKVNPVSRQITAVVEAVTDGTNNAATVAVAISPDNSTFTTLATPGASAAVNAVGAVTSALAVTLPQGWYIKATFAHATVAASIYY